MNEWTEQSFLEELVYMECEELGRNGWMEVCTYSWTVILDVSGSKGLLAHHGRVRFCFIPRASI